MIVTDASCNDPGRCFQRSGIWSRAHRAGAQVVLPADHRFRSMRLRGEVLDEWPVYRTLIEADCVINMPVAKHHNLARYTAAMKNWYGVLGGRRNRLHQSIDMSVADLATFMRPTLTIVDAVRVLLRNGFRELRATKHRHFADDADPPHLVTVPFHRRTLKRDTLHSIIRQAGWTVDEFLEKL